MNATEWLAAYAEKLGVDPPSAADFRLVLELAGEAAHGSERVAAPVSCWLTARAGVSPDEGLRLAREVSAGG